MSKITITPDNLQEHLADATTTLLNLARESSWNKISDNCLYILSPFDYAIYKKPFQQNVVRKIANDSKKPVLLNTVMLRLLEMYPQLYEIDLFVFKASKSQTIIEIEYRLKNKLEPEYRETVIDDAPMLHCKVSLPFYVANDKKRKFDINWQNNTLWHRANLFWARLKFRIELIFNPVS